MDKENNIIVDDQLNERRIRPLRVFLIGLLGLFIVCASFIGFLQWTTFEDFQTQMSLSDFQNSNYDVGYDSGDIVVTIPTALVSQVLYDSYAQALESSPYELHNLYIDSSTQEVQVSLTLAGFYLPLSFQINPSIEGNQLHLTYDQFYFSSRGFEAGGFFGLVFRAISPIESLQDMVIDLEDFPFKEGVYLEEIEPVEEGWLLRMAFDSGRMNALVEAFQAGIDPEVYEIFLGSIEEDRTPEEDWIARLMEQAYPVEQEQSDRLIEDALGEQVLLKKVLMMLSPRALTEMATELEASGLLLDQEEILLGQKAFVGQEKDELIDALFVALADHFEEKMLAFNQGKPFDMDLMRTLTVKVLADMYDIILVAEDVDKLTFVYDEGFKIAYQVDDDAYYIRSLESYQVVNGATYWAMTGAGIYTKPNYVNNPELWQKVVDFVAAYHGSEGIFVRYMKSDGESVFAVISLVENPQDYWPMAMMIEEEGQIVVLDENVKNVASFMMDFPEFNAETIPLEVETVSFKQLQDSTLAVILEELASLRMIPSASSVEVVYSSYNGKYIAFKLSNGAEYVYSVEGTSFGTYLKTVYSKEKALRNWRDLPELLVLQDSPLEED